MEKLNIGEKIKKYREMQGITQSELGRLLSVSNRAVSKWENGESYPSLELIKPISEILNVGIKELLGEKPDVSKTMSEPKGIKSPSKETKLSVIISAEEKYLDSKLLR